MKFTILFHDTTDRPYASTVKEKKNRGSMAKWAIKNIPPDSPNGPCARITILDGHNCVLDIAI